ncbi:MAG: divergent PAP2 family protein [Chloroflexota bacterium]|nr:MAG: divergent PAP2 family protein [Chloroflexota bacterium]HDD55448.1 divergent PAP2 family protein [Chloroflexota bacterium]
MSLREVLLFNPVLLSALTAWMIAQVLKVVIELIVTKRINWGLLFQAGGMPSSHSALVSATALSSGLVYGFSSAVFSVAAVLAMIVIYDATGVRREAGRQAVLINSIIEELSKGKIPPQEKLKEMLGHTPGEAFLGTLLGLLIGFIGGVS